MFNLDSESMLKTYLKKSTFADRHILNSKMRKTMFQSLILPVLNYCNIAYYSYLDLMSKNRLQYFQNVCCRFMFNLRKHAHVSAKINNSRWLNVQDIVK